MELLFWTAGGTSFIFLMTCFGASMVLFFREPSTGRVQKMFLGFAAGVMIAASVWSLLIPAIQEAEAVGMVGWVPAAFGFTLGVAFLHELDKLLPKVLAAIGGDKCVDCGKKRTALLVFAVTLHNIPEGMAVGLSFALAAQHTDNPLLYASAAALALGIGIQNFPEGAAISLPLRQEGMSRGKAFVSGCLSGVVEPIFGMMSAIVAGMIAPLMPWLLSFAAGAMMYVVAQELIPGARADKNSNSGTLGVMAGFLIMMILDVALG